jgi:hypothetical protein
MRPREGDVLVSRMPARVEHELSVVPQRPEWVCPNHNAAIERAQELARERRVDVWLTEDNIHVLKIASYRDDGQMPR